MPTRAQVVELLDRGLSYEEAAAQLHIPPGQAYMIATGVAADSSDSPHPDELRGKHVLDSAQSLVSPPVHNPTRDESVVAWVRQRAARDMAKPASGQES